MFKKLKKKILNNSKINLIKYQNKKMKKIKLKKKKKKVKKEQK